MLRTYRSEIFAPLRPPALGTSSFPVDRPRLAELLGFDGVAENSFDATQISAVDLRAEACHVASVAALTVGMLIADITQQYAQVRPWLVLEQGADRCVFHHVGRANAEPVQFGWLRKLASSVASGAIVGVPRTRRASIGSSIQMTTKIQHPDP